MKFFHAIIMISLLTPSDLSLAYSSIPDHEICQFDKSTMIKQKLKKAKECIASGNYTGAETYLNGILALDPNNEEAKSLLEICNNGGRSETSAGGSSSSSGSYNTGSGSSLSVSKTDLYFNSDGGTEYITVTSGSSWYISISPNNWGHLTRSGNTLALNVSANTSSSSRTDYFKLQSGSQVVKINITQAGYRSESTSSDATASLKVSKSELFFSPEGGRESISVSSGSNWKISVNTTSWGHLSSEGNTLSLTVDANTTGAQRSDYFILSAGGVEKRINILQSPTYANNKVPMSGTTRVYTDNAMSLSYLAQNIRDWQKCRMGTMTENGAGVVVYGSNGYAKTGSLNSSFVSKIKELNTNRETFKSISFTASGYYCIVYGKNGWYGNVPQSMQTQLNQYHNDHEDIYCVSISESGDFVVISDKHFYASNTVDMSNLRNAYDMYGQIKYACVTNRGLVAICEKGIFYSNIPVNLEFKLKTMNFKPDKIVFTDSGTYLITNEFEAYSYNM